MRGNVYLSIPAADFNNPLPFTFWDWTVTATDPNDLEAEPEVITIHPTWSELADKNKPLYGEVVTVNVAEEEYKLIELTASWLNGEVSALLTLGAGQPSYNYTLMTQAEAQAFVAENAPVSPLQ